MADKTIDEIVKELRDSQRNIKVIDGSVVELRLSEFVVSGRARVVQSDDPRIEMVVITRADPPLAEVERVVIETKRRLKDEMPPFIE